MWRLWVRVCPERLLALPHVSCMCREPAQAELGAGALHHRVSHYEVRIAPKSAPSPEASATPQLTAELVVSVFSSVLCSCWWLPRPTWRLRAYGSLSRDVCQWNPTPVWRLGDRLISGKLCKFTVIQSKFNVGAAEWMDDISCSGWSSKNCCLNNMTFIVLIIWLVVWSIKYQNMVKRKMWISDSVVCFVHNPKTLSLLS